MHSTMIILGTMLSTQYMLLMETMNLIGVALWDFALAIYAIFLAQTHT